MYMYKHYLYVYAFLCIYVSFCVYVDARASIYAIYLRRYKCMEVNTRTLHVNARAHYLKMLPTVAFTSQASPRTRAGVRDRMTT